MIAGVSPNSNINTIAAGQRHTVGLTSNGTVVAAGDSKQGQCNVGDWYNIKVHNLY